MSDAKRIINFRFDRYEETERKLEKLAAKGLFLKECGTFLWTFRKGMPKKVKYTVTYFPEGSVFNPGITDNQQTYFDYAKAAGWNFVTGLNQMQIFSSEDADPIPFETDEKEKLDNIKRCMKKSFLPSMLVMIFVFTLNLLVQFNSFKLSPIDFLSDTSRLLRVLMFIAIILYNVYTLIDYSAWCRRSEKSIAICGACARRSNLVRRIVDTVFMFFILSSTACLLFHLAAKTSRLGLLLTLAQIPVLVIVFRSSIKYLKKKKASAKKNKAISFAMLIAADFAYVALLMIFIMQFGFSAGDASNYRTVDWQLTKTESHEFKLYSDEIPLTCQDLCGPIDYDYYSYEGKTDSTLFVSRSSYRQDSLPAKDSPPEIEYEIIEPGFDFVYRLAREDLLEIPDWQDNASFNLIDNKPFGTVEAYQRHYGDSPTGYYALFFEDKIIVLHMEEALTPKQIALVKDKLQI